MIKWNQAYANIQRLRQIINVFIKHGFGFLVEQLDLSSYISVGKRLRLIKDDKEEAEKLSPPERAVRAFEELGPAFIKLGQFLSTRKDLLPPNYIKEFEKLKDQIAPFPLDRVYKTIELELGKAVEELFPTFDETSFAAASIAQVHYARLASGEDVVIKVQRPGIEKIIHADLRIFHTLAGQFKKTISKGIFDPLEVIKEFERIMSNELDFNQEAVHIEQFANNFREDKTVCFPRVYWELTSQRVLVMERICGYAAGDWEAIDAKGLVRAEIAANFYNMSMTQFVEHGFFHADPHSSNIFILEDGRLGIVDCGMTGQLDKKVMDSFFEVFSGFILLDMDRVLDGYMSIDVLPEDVNMEQFKSDMAEIAERYFRYNVHQIKIPEFMEDVIKVGPRHRMHLPPYFFVVMKALSLIDTTAKQIYPSFDIPAASKEYIKKIMAERSHPRFLFENTAKTFSDVYRLMQSFPVQFNRVMKQLEKGRFGAKVEMGITSELRQDLHRLVNRLFFGFVITGIIIGSSIIIQSDMGFRLLNIPFLGVFGYLMANVISLWVLYTIYRSGLW